MNDLYLFIDDLIERNEDPNRYNDILNLEKEIIEMSLMNEIDQELPF